MRYTVTYEPIKRSETKPFMCRVCGKRGKKSTTFRQTLSPFNKNAAGELKTVAEIEAELLARCEAWEPDPVHAKCEAES